MPSLASSPEHFGGLYTATRPSGRSRLSSRHSSRLLKSLRPIRRSLFTGAMGAARHCEGWYACGADSSDNQFLFDHCRCPSCFQPKTKQRLKTLGPVGRPLLAPLTSFQVNPDVKINSLEVKDGAVNIAWGTTPTHQSTFPLSFLQQASYDPPLLNRDQLLDRVP